MDLLRASEICRASKIPYKIDTEHTCTWTDGVLNTAAGLAHLLPRHSGYQNHTAFSHKCGILLTVFVISQNNIY